MFNVKKWHAGFVGLLFLCIVGSGCGKKQPGFQAEERFTVKKVDLRDIITQTGEVQPVVKVELKSEASGKIEKIFIKEGQKISRGDTILVIDPSRLQTQRKKLQLSIKRARIEVSMAERDYNNARELTATGSLSEKKLQDLQMAHELASIGYQQQLLELKDIDEQLGKTVITAPMSGVVTALLVEEGEIAVSATSGFQSGTAIGTIADIERLEVIATVGEVDYVHLKKGQIVTIRPEALENTQTKGSIGFIALNAKKNPRNELAGFEVRISVDSLIPGIAPGINVNVDFVILEKKDVIGVPFHFVRKDQDKSSVLVISKNPDGSEIIVSREVQPGATDYRHYEIISGLTEGSVIIFKPQTHTEDGAMGNRGRR